MSDAHSYKAFLVRCWKEHASFDLLKWRFMAEEVGGQRRKKAFSDLKGLFDFLEENIQSPEKADPKDESE